MAYHLIRIRRRINNHMFYCQANKYMYVRFQKSV